MFNSGLDFTKENKVIHAGTINRLYTTAVQARVPVYNRQETTCTTTYSVVSLSIIQMNNSFIYGLVRLDFKDIRALRCFKFWKSVYISSNGVLRTVYSCFANSQDFNQFCSLYGISVMYMKYNELTCIVYEHRRGLNTV